MRKTRLAGATAVAAAATLTLMPAANADRTAFREHRGDAPRHIDLTAALVDNGGADPDLATIRIRVAGKLQIGDDVTVWFNRDPSDAGPELRLRGFVDSEYMLRRVHTWNGPGKAASCARFSMKQLKDNTGVRVRINRSCLVNRPVRAAIRTHADGGAIDWFHGRRTWLTAVKH